MQKIVLIVGIMLLVLGIFISFSASNIMREVQSVKNQYEPSDYDAVAHYEKALQNIWNIVSPFGMMGIIVLLIGISLTGLSFVLPIEKRMQKS